MDFSWLERLSRILKICLQITFAAGLFATVFLSGILRMFFAGYFGISPGDDLYYWACVILLTPCGICSLYILWQLIALLETIHNRDPFNKRNVKGMKGIAVSSFVISAMFVVLMIVQPTMLTFAIGYIFLIAGFCFIILAGLFRKAEEYKDENNLTI